jgi:hypothetical protein
MPRTFAYLRVSTAGQTMDDQLQEIAAAGFKVEPDWGWPRAHPREPVSCRMKLQTSKSHNTAVSVRAGAGVAGKHALLA